jgi:hypothetical protein
MWLESIAPIIHVGVAGEGPQDFLVAIPKAARVIRYAYYVQGVANPISNLLQTIVNNKEAALVTRVLTGNIFSDPVTTNGNGSAVTLPLGTHIRWTVRSNAGSANTFYLAVSWHDE